MPSLFAAERVPLPESVPDVAAVNVRLTMGLELTPGPLSPWMCAKLAAVPRPVKVPLSVKSPVTSSRETVHVPVPEEPVGGTSCAPVRFALSWRVAADENEAWNRKSTDQRACQSFHGSSADDDAGNPFKARTRHFLKSISAVEVVKSMRYAKNEAPISGGAVPHSSEFR